MRDVVGGEELLIGTGAADFELAGAVGVKPKGRAPAIDELASTDGGMGAGEDVALLPGVLRAGEGGRDIGIVAEGGVDARLVDQIDELGHDLDVFLNGSAGRVEHVGFVLVGRVDLVNAAGGAGVDAVELGGLAEITEERGCGRLRS